MMSTKRELQEQLNSKILEVEKMKLEFDMIRKEYSRFTEFLSVLAYTMKEVYVKYPYIVSECTTDKELIKLLQVNIELHDLIEKMKRQREGEDNEKGWKDEI